VYFVPFWCFVVKPYYRDKKVVSVFVRFSCVASTLLKSSFCSRRSTKHSTRSRSAEGVFKVETVGDCYVAVAGLQILARTTLSLWFASPETVCTMHQLTRAEVVLGRPADLSMRFGLAVAQ
jgi:hypothetical protein